MLYIIDSILYLWPAIFKILISETVGNWGNWDLVLAAEWRGWKGDVSEQDQGARGPESAARGLSSRNPGVAGCWSWGRWLVTPGLPARNPGVMGA